MKNDLIERLGKIRGFEIIKSDQQHTLVDLRAFAMDTAELIRRLSKHGVAIQQCGKDCIEIDSESLKPELIDAINNTVSEWGRDLANRNIEDVLKGGICVGRRDCEYYPCHFEGQDCTFCFCPFYPCNDERTGGRYVERSSGGKVWSCVDCTIIHEPDVAEEVLEGLKALKPGEDMRSVFERVIVKRLVSRGL